MHSALIIDQPIATRFGRHYLLSDSGIVSVECISYVDISHIEQGSARIYIPNVDREIYVTGIALLELVWLLKPSATEGKRLTWQKNAWIFHNLVAHPVMQLLAFVRLYKWAIWVHDVTVPKPIGYKA